MSTGLRWLSRRTARSRGDHDEERTLSAATVPPVMLPGATQGGVTPTSALAIADSWACVRALADAAASLPLIVYRRAAAGRVRANGRTADLLRRPAPATTQSNLIAQLMAHLNLHGNAYLGKFRDGGGSVAQLSLLPPDRVVPELRAGVPRYAYTDQNGHRSHLTTADVIHFRGLSIDGLIGLSPVRQCRAALGLSSTLTTHAQKFFENDGRPGGILSIPDGPSPEQAKQWTDRMSGAENAHRVALVQGDIKFTPISMPHDDAQFLEQRRLSATEVARIFRVPPWIIAAEDGGSLTYSNVEQQAEAFVKFALQPWLATIEQALTADSDLFTGGLYCEFLLDGLLRADAATRSDIYTRALDPATGWMTRAEVRRLENLEEETP